MLVRFIAATLIFMTIQPQMNPQVPPLANHKKSNKDSQKAMAVDGNPPVHVLSSYKFTTKIFTAE